MKRWVSDLPAPPVRKWQSRAEILKESLDSLGPDDLLRVRPDYYPMPFGWRSLQHDYARKYDPNQPRVPAGNPDGGQWTNADGSSGADEQRTRTAARISPGREAECEAQYKLDSAICRIVQTRLCWEQAMKRRAACISGYQLPPLNF